MCDLKVSLITGYLSSAGIPAGLYVHVIYRCILSNDPGKNCTIFYCSDAISFPHIETVVFLGQEFLN